MKKPTNEYKFEGKAKQRIFRGYLNTEDTFELEVVQLYSEGYDPILVTQADVYVSYFKDVPAQITESNYGLDMSSIIARNYTGFIDAVKSNRLFTFQFLLNEIDINRFTHITPVWIEKFSNYFFVKKINNWEAGRVYSVEMLQLYDSGAIGTRQVITAVKYGLLYNWYAATDARNIAADGWEVPIMDDFNELATYLISNSGDKLKEFGLTYWDTGNNGDNSAGFNGRGSGSRDLGISGFNYLKISSYFWDRNDLTFPYVGYGQLIYNNSNLTGDGGNNAGIGLSIRLIKTTTTLSDGETGTYTGNDGKVYRTICIVTGKQIGRAHV